MPKKAQKILENVAVGVGVFRLAYVGGVEESAGETAGHRRLCERPAYLEPHSKDWSNLLKLRSYSLHCTEDDSISPEIWP